MQNLGFLNRSYEGCNLWSLWGFGSLVMSTVISEIMKHSYHASRWNLKNSQKSRRENRPTETAVPYSRKLLGHTESICIIMSMNTITTVNRKNLIFFSQTPNQKVQCPVCPGNRCCFRLVMFRWGWWLLSPVFIQSCCINQVFHRVQQERGCLTRGLGSGVLWGPQGWLWPLMGAVPWAPKASDTFGKQWARETSNQGHWAQPWTETTHRWGWDGAWLSQSRVQRCGWRWCAWRSLGSSLGTAGLEGALRDPAQKSQVKPAALVCLGIWSILGRDTFWGSYLSRNVLCCHLLHSRTC